MRKNTHPVYSGALLLTITGLFCRLLGFYYKIFLSRAIGAKELGLYQLAMPLLAVGIAFANSGIHTAISRFVAKSSSAKDGREKSYLAMGMCLSLALSAVFCIPCLLFADSIAAGLFHEPSIKTLLYPLILCIPLECIHGCINGYYYGLQKSKIPSIGQCIEQVVRIGSVMGIYYITIHSGLPFTKFHAMLGLLLGEIAATFYYLNLLSLSQKQIRKKPIAQVNTTCKDLLSMACPLTATRLLLTVLHGIENIMIPLCLVRFGLTNTQSLSIYGIYSGMALPMIFFPTVLSNSIAVMLLPSISRAKEEGRNYYIRHSITVGFFLCMFLGFLCSFFFYFFSPLIGQKIFANEVAGIYIRTLSWLCPFLFLGTTMNSILNGLGNVKDTFFNSMTGALIRLAFIFFGIPLYGFRAFLLGVLCSQVVSAFMAYLRLLSITCKKNA